MEPTEKVLSPLFELVGPAGESWRLYEDGRAEGFPAGTQVTGHARSRLDELRERLRNVAEGLQSIESLAAELGRFAGQPTTEGESFGPVSHDPHAPQVHYGAVLPDGVRCSVTVQRDRVWESTTYPAESGRGERMVMCVRWPTQIERTLLKAAIRNEGAPGREVVLRLAPHALPGSA